MLNNDPDWDPKLFAGKTRLYYGRWTYKYESAARQGAAGAIIIHTTPSAGYPWQVVQSSWGGEQFELPAEGEPRIQLKGWATEEAVRRLVKAGGQDLDKLIAAAHSRNFKPVPLGITHVDRRSRTRCRACRPANVAGLLPGSDPKLKRRGGGVLARTTITSASAQPDASGDKIYNGAVDNASGCAQVLAIARAFAALAGAAAPLGADPVRRPGKSRGCSARSTTRCIRRSRPGKIAADINFDGGNIFGPHARHHATSARASHRSTQVVESAGRRTQGRVVEPDQFPGSRLLLSLRSVHLRQDRRAGASTSTAAPTSSASPPDWGRQQNEALGGAHLSPAERRDRRQLEFRRHDRGCAAWVSTRAGSSRRRTRCRRGTRGTSSRRARKKALAAAGQ